MPTPSGVNYLLQFLMISSNSPIIRLQESKVDVLSYVLMFVVMLPYAAMLKEVKHYFNGKDSDFF